MSLKFEQYVLGVLLCREDLNIPQVEEALFIVNRNHFESIEHRIIFDHVRQANISNTPLCWKDIAKVEFSYIADLANSARSLENLKYYCTELKKMAELRELKNTVHTANAKIANSDSLSKSLDVVDNLAKLIYRNTSGGFNFDSAPEINVQVYNYHEAEEGDQRLPSGDSLLDEVLGGGILKPSINVLAGQSGTGKTTYAAKLLDGVCLNNTFQCAMFSLEMSTLRVSEMLLCQHKQIPRSDFKAKHVEYFRQPLDSLLANNNLHICPSKSMSIEEIFLKARYLNAKHDLDFVFIDFLTAVSVEKKCGSEYEQINHIMKTIADISAELNVAVVLLAQLNRGLSNTKDGKPALWHLKGSSSIENFADHVFFVHRDTIANPDCPHPYLELLISKNRYGKLGSIFYESRDGTIFDTDQSKARAEVAKWSKNKNAPSDFDFTL